MANHKASLGDGIGWPNLEDLEIYGLRSPWYSGLTHALALSLFVRAHQLEPNAGWSSWAVETWQGFDVPIEAGGFCRRHGDGVIYEEYPRRDLDCAFSGMCHALIGLWECWRSDIIPDAQRQFLAGLAGLRSCLNRFAHGQWSLYSLNESLGRPLLASPYYQRMNGLLAQVIGIIADDSKFRRLGESWVNNSDSFLRRIALSLRIAVDRYRVAPVLLHSDKTKIS
jgi:hypothetical protein